MAAHSYCPVGSCNFVATADTLKQAEALLRSHRADEHGEGLRLREAIVANLPAWSEFLPGAGAVLPLLSGPVIAGKALRETPKNGD